MTYLADTNIFLEILLGQQNSEKCKAFLEKHSGNLAITDFSLHTIGLILFREKNFLLFDSFLSDVIPRIEVLNIMLDGYSKISLNAEKYKLDFDDAYILTVASSYNLKIKTQDKDFERAIPDFEIEFI